MNSNNSLRIVQIIDSLSPGGSEQIAVSLSNALALQGNKVSLIATRTGGMLQSKLHPSVHLDILNKKNTLDLRSFRKLVKILKQANCEIIHAHSTSIIWATIAAMFWRRSKVIWHIHWGNTASQGKLKTTINRVFSVGWSAIITVNENLSAWAASALHFNKNRIFFINNFTQTSGVVKELKEFEVFFNAVNIVCVANIRPEKDHDNLLKAFRIVAERSPAAHLHLIGRSFNDDYSNLILEKIKKHDFSDRIHYYGLRNDIPSILRYMQIGVLPSFSEGLPVSLLEYGAASLSVVATDVGQVREVLENGMCGAIVAPSQPHELANGMLQLIDDLKSTTGMAERFHHRVIECYSENAALKKITEIYQLVTSCSKPQK